MSRRPALRGGVQLPRRLQQELGLDLNKQDRQTSRNHARGGRAGDRKIKQQPKHVGSRPKRSGQPTERLRQASDKADYDDGDGSSENHNDRAADKRMSKSVTNTRLLAKGKASIAGDSERKPTIRFERPPAIQRSPSSTISSSGERSLSPGLVLDKTSKTFQDRNAHDEAEILALEKKLGLGKRKRLPKSFDEDGLGDLLEGIDEEDILESTERKREEREWLERKRRRTRVDDERNHNDTTRGKDVQDTKLEVEVNDSVDEDTEAFDSDDDDFNGFPTTDKPAECDTPRKRENPYVAPTTDAKVTSKYIPPSMRKPANLDTTVSERLHRQLQGQLNKLSEANLLSILAEVEKLYQANARQDVTSALIDLLLTLFCDPAVLQNTFVILHASFVAALYKVNGTDFGAEFVSQLVDRFENFRGKNELRAGKQGINLVSLLSHLYTFHVVSANLMFDHIRILLETPSEEHAELLLRIVRDTGPQLRQDDPSSLKDIVLRMQDTSAKAERNGDSVSVRTKFMIESITDLKNNKLKTHNSSGAVSSEHITRMRKVLGTLNSRNLRASEPLRIGLADLRNADKRGKWWVIGASWNQADRVDDIQPVVNSANDAHSNVDALGFQEEDLVLLARQHRMNTAIRRGIFITIMSATDYKDAHVRLLKLRLKRSQEQEIPRVVMHCAGAEAKHNPYYGLIAKTLCTDRRMTMAFQFGLWAFFRRMGEKDDESDSNGEGGEDERNGENVEMKEVVNIAKMFGQLIADEIVSLGVLKTLNLFLLKEKARAFVEVLLIVVILRSQEGESNQRAENRVAGIFAKCKDSPQVIAGLRYFLKKVVRRTDLVASKSDGELVRRGSGTALDMLKILSSGHSERMY